MSARQLLLQKHTHGCRPISGVEVSRTAESTAGMIDLLDIKTARHTQHTSVCAIHCT